MSNISQGVITNPETYIDTPMSNELTGASIKSEVLNEYEGQDVTMQVWPEFSTGDTINSTAAMFLKKETIIQEKETATFETHVEELDTKEKMLNDEVEQDMKVEICSELPTIRTHHTLNSTAAMFVKEEMIIKEEIINIEPHVEELCTKEKILNDVVQQDVKLEIWPELPTITTGGTLNSMAALFEKQETPLIKTASLINTDIAIGNENDEEITVNGARRVNCKVCGRFYRKDYISKHLRVHTGERPISCEICGKTFKDSSAKWSHKLIHKGQHEYACKVCGKKFLRSDNLKEHLIVHSDERPFPCEKCGKCFPSRTRLGQHMISHLEVKRYECHLCGKMFKQKFNMNIHLSSRCKGRS